MTAPSDQPRATLSLSPAALQELEAQAAAVGESDVAATEADDVELAITVRDLSAWYGARRVIRDVSMDIRANAITAIIGPSGSGKSTLLRCLDRMQRAVEIRLAGGQRDHRLARRTQFPCLDGHRHAGGNLNPA